MHDPHWCPVCDFGPGKSLQQVRSHVNSMSGFDGDHDWSKLQAVVREQQSDQPETSEPTENDQPADQPESAGSDDAGTDDQREPAGDQQETSENTGSDQPESGGDSAGSDPYEEQWGEITGDGTGDDQPESGNCSDSETSETTSDTGGSTSQNTSNSGGSGAAWALVAGVVVAVAYALTSANRQNPDEAATVEDDPDEADSETDTDEGGPSPDPIT